MIKNKKFDIKVIITLQKEVVENYKSVCNRFTMINGLILQVFGKLVAINYGI